MLLFISKTPRASAKPTPAPAECLYARLYTRNAPIRDGLSNAAAKTSIADKTLQTHENRQITQRMQSSDLRRLIYDFRNRAERSGLSRLQRRRAKPAPKCVRDGRKSQRCQEQPPDSVQPRVHDTRLAPTRGLEVTRGVLFQRGEAGGKHGLIADMMCNLAKRGVSKGLPNEAASIDRFARGIGQVLGRGQRSSRHQRADVGALIHCGHPAQCDLAGGNCRITLAELGEYLAMTAREQKAHRVELARARQ